MSLDAYAYRAEPGRPSAPLLVLFHGTGGRPDDLLPLGRELLPGASLLAPAGDVSEGGAARFFRRTGEGVYDMADLARAATRMAAFVRAHRERLRPSSTVGLGYSNGANILAATLFADPALWDAAVLLHPLIPFQPEPRGSLAEKPVLITAGRHDPICPPALTARLAAWLEAAGSALTLEWHEGGHELRRSEVEASRRFLARFREKEGPAMTDKPLGAIRLDELDRRGRYSLPLDDGTEAELTFSRDNDGDMVIGHTFTPPKHRGQGIALRLVERAVADAEASGRRIVPLCPYVAAEFRRHPEWTALAKR